jgi:hypothetical protein
MNKRSFVCGVATILFITVFILAGCEQIPGNGNGLGRESPFDLDSPLLIEVWDSSTPPQFLGYDTGLHDFYNTSDSLILTSSGYCVSLRGVRYYRDGKKYYGGIADKPQSMDIDTWSEIMKNGGWGYAVFFDTASDPTANDTPYALWTSNIVNDVMYNPHNGGTYYTWDTNAAPRDITIRADYKFYDNMGTIRTWNHDYDFWGEGNSRIGEQYLRGPSSAFIGETGSFQPLKKIGGYAELGLPNPKDVTPPLIYKVTY